MMQQPHIIGVDLGKHWFHLVGLDRDGAVVLRKKMSRTQLSAVAATAPRTVVAMESCSGSQYWGRLFAQAGHEVRSRAKRHEFGLAWMPTNGRHREMARCGESVADVRRPARIAWHECGLCPQGND